ncbi:hypothetical protein DOT_0684 [Desulfosporosinus sp. OT]|nr:hypothetical protein DOT_0684 [Desulfosporosinus sp. OT]
MLGVNIRKTVIKNSSGLKYACNINEKRAEILGSLLVYWDKNLDLSNYVAGFSL